MVQLCHESSPLSSCLPVCLTVSPPPSIPLMILPACLIPPLSLPRVTPVLLMSLSVVFDGVAEMIDGEPDGVQRCLHVLEGGLPVPPQPVSLLLQLLKVCNTQGHKVMEL